MFKYFQGEKDEVEGNSEEGEIDDDEENGEEGELVKSPGRNEDELQDRKAIFEKANVETINKGANDEDEASRDHSRYNIGMEFGDANETEDVDRVCDSNANKEQINVMSLEPETNEAAHSTVDQSKTIDLNAIPSEIQEETEEDREKTYFGENRHKKNKKERKYKKANNSKNGTISMKFKDVMLTNNSRRHKSVEGVQVSQSNSNKSSNSLSVEIHRTKNIGEEIGIRLEGFEEQLREVSEGECVLKQQS
ncbi:hypothetical protein L1887_31786 [Cichorium endivia]|nr:hypothetical protein L1887_31786 [Cichorium endivia]